MPTRVKRVRIQCQTVEEEVVGEVVSGAKAVGEVVAGAEAVGEVAGEVAGKLRNLF